MTHSPNNPPPRLARWLANLAIPRREREFVLGDLEEGFHERLASSAARRWYWRETLNLFTTRWPRGPRVPHDVLHRPGASPMSSFWNEVRIAIRSLRRAPLYASLAIVTAAVGIGASTAIFSVAKPIVFDAAPYPSPDKLVMVWERDASGESSNIGFFTFQDLARDVRAFSSSAAMSYWQPTLASEAAAEQVNGQRVSHTYFTTLGVRPFLGRDFRPEEDTPETRTVVMLTHKLWKRRYASDSSIAGRTVEISGRQYTVAGVLPESFEDLMTPNAELYGPLGYNATLSWACRSCRHLRMVARVREGATLSAASQEVERSLANLRAIFKSEYGSVGGVLEPVSTYATKGVRPAVLALLGAAALLLLMSCANVSSLMLGRAIERQGDVAVRTALGAKTSKLVRQSAVEALVLWSIAAVAGILLARWGARALVLLSATPLPRVERMVVDWRVMTFGLVGAFVCALIAGAFPAALTARAALIDRMRSGARNIVGSGTQRVRGALIVAEVALALIMLSGTGLLIRTVNRLLNVELGYDAARIATVNTSLSGPRYATNEAGFAYYRRVLDAAKSVPGVEVAGLVSQLPLGGNFDAYGIHRKDKPSANPENDPSAQRFAVSTDYLSAMRIPLLAGRVFSASDDARGARVVIINEEMAAKVYADGSPLGREIQIGGTDGPWYTIIGVVKNVRHLSLDGEQDLQMYHPVDQSGSSLPGSLILVARTKGDPRTLALALQRAVRAIDPGVAVYEPRAMQDVVSSAMSQRRFVLRLLAVFAGVALVLVSAGLYGVTAAGVAERRREIGLRAALGASRPRIVSTVVSRSATLLGVGVALGVAGAVALNGVLKSILFGVSPTDPLTILSMIGVLLIVAVLAAVIPAGRALAVDPATTLRTE
jgi:putative ABC transport system permease protein